MATEARTRPTSALVAVLLLGAVVVGMLVMSQLQRDDVGVAGRDGVLVVRMESYRFVPSEFRAPAGEPVTIRIVNGDTAPHHVSFGRHVTGQEERATGFAEDLFAGLDPVVTPAAAQAEMEPPYEGFTVLVQPGETVDIEVTLPQERAGSWQIGCFTGQGCHYRAGLAASLEVR